MREIKFRIWDKKNKKMIYSDGLISYFDDDGMEHLSQEVMFADMWGNALIYHHSTGGTDDVKLVEDGILMQCVGLEDVDETEIYEGDIVEYENGNAGYGRPRHEEISRDVIPDITNHDEYVDGVQFWTEGKVLGNIHENPELLGGD